MWQVGIIEDCLDGPQGERFARARAIGFDAVELQFGASDPEASPLWTEEGARATRKLADDAGVTLSSVCATYFNTHGLGSLDAATRRKSVEVLQRLIDTAAVAGLRVILLPFFGAGAIETPESQQWAVESVMTCSRRASEREIKLAFEATLSARVLRNMAHRVMSLTTGVYYDVGNIVPAGYDVVDDLETLADVLFGVHIKDRTRTGDNVPLGRGGVDFARVLRGLSAARYHGPLILETPKGNDPQRSAMANLAFVREHLVV